MHVAVTAVGADRPGIVAAVSQVLYRLGCNIEDSRMSLLGGHFAMMLIVAPPGGVESATLEEALREPAQELDLVVSVRAVSDIDSHEPEGEGYVVSVYGADAPGIVAQVTGALAQRGGNIVDLATNVVQGERPLYVMILEVRFPPGAPFDDIRREMRALGERLGVDVTIRPLETETL